MSVSPNNAVSSLSAAQALSQSSSSSSSSSSAIDSTVSSVAVLSILSQASASAAKKSLAEKQLEIISKLYPESSHPAILKFFNAVVVSYKAETKASLAAVEEAFDGLKNSATTKQIQTLAKQAQKMAQANKAFENGANPGLVKFLEAKIQGTVASKENPPVVSDLALSDKGTVSPKSSASFSSTAPAEDRPSIIDVPADVPKGEGYCLKAAIGTGVVAATLLGAHYYLSRESGDTPLTLQTPGQTFFFSNRNETCPIPGQPELEETAFFSLSNVCQAAPKPGTLTEKVLNAFKSAPDQLDSFTKTVGRQITPAAAGFGKGTQNVVGTVVTGIGTVLTLAGITKLFGGCFRRRAEQAPVVDNAPPQSSRSVIGAPMAHTGAAPVLQPVALPTVQVADPNLS